MTAYLRTWSTVTVFGIAVAKMDRQDGRSPPR
jgi:hypothetical protein